MERYVCWSCAEEGGSHLSVPIVFYYTIASFPGLSCVEFDKFYKQKAWGRGYCTTSFSYSCLQTQ